MPFSLLKTVLCMEEAERFANPRAKAQYRLTDKINAKKERKDMQSRAGGSRIRLCADTTFKDCSFPHLRLHIPNIKGLLPI